MRHFVAYVDIQPRHENGTNKPLRNVSEPQECKNKLLTTCHKLFHQSCRPRHCNLMHVFSIKKLYSNFLKI